MILNEQQISDLKLVTNAVQAGQRSSTYDATVGKIISEGVIIDAASFTLPRRGIVWVVSKEEFTLPNDITGLATLRTTWTHKGVLALNLGIIDPGWSGPLATALVNFGNGNFQIAKGDPFFRVMFHQHAPTQAQTVSTKNYVETIVDKSRLFSKTFLGMESLVHEVSEKVLSFPRWALAIGFAAIIVSILAVYVPISYSEAEEFLKTRNSNAERIDQLEKNVQHLTTTLNDIQGQQSSTFHTMPKPTSPPSTR
jgi:deoxycytidine triphosphate deaminase